MKNILKGKDMNKKEIECFLELHIQSTNEIAEVLQLPIEN